MKIIKFFSLAVLLAFVATSCSKDDGVRKFRLLTNPMRNASKISVTPSTNASSWVAGESINLNGYQCAITEEQVNETSQFSITCSTAVSTPVYAIYPYTMESGDNVITTTYNGESSTMKLKHLTVKFNDDRTKHEVIFPMAAKATTNTDKLLFDHLTAGFKITIQNNSENALTLSAVRVFVQCPQSTDVNPVTHNGVSVSWERQGLIVPSGPIGINGDVSLQNACEMYFKMKTGNSDNVVIPGNGSITFWAPATVKAVSNITITGVGADGVDVFARTKTISTTITRNNMYTIPTINYPNEPQSK